MTGTKMFAKIKELKALGYKKLTAANELNVDVKKSENIGIWMKPHTRNIFNQPRADQK